MTISDSHIINITNNYIEDISHGGFLSDSDGIVVFTNKSIVGRYDRDLVNISNNYIKDCDGRFLKLQTNGQCTVSGNLMKLEKAMTLIEYWKGIDVQGGNSTIVNNKIHIGSEYGGAGGAYSMLLQVQRASSSNLDYNNEGHVTLVKDNVFNLEKKIKYGIGLEPIAESTATTLIYRVHNNTIQGGADSSIGGADSTTIRPDVFIYAGGHNFPRPDVFTGNMVWDIRDNMVDCLEFLEVDADFKANKVATETVQTGADTLTLGGHGVPTSDVNTSTEIITANSHSLDTAQAVKYFDGGGTALAGLTSGTTYYVIKVDGNSYKLATTADNANADTAINLTGTGNNAQYITPFHNLSTGDVVVYDNGGGATLTGLSNKYPYWVINVDGYKIKLATTAANASAGTAVNLTGQGSDDQYFAMDYHGKWFLYVINNTKWPAGTSKDVLNGGETQTSSLCASGNTNGKESLRVDYSIDFAELMAGCNFGSGGGMRVRNDPGTYRNCNIRKNRIWVVEDGTEFFTAAAVAAGASWTTTT